VQKGATPQEAKETVIMRNWQCRQEIDATICKLKAKKRRYDQAEGRRLAVRGHYDLKPSAEKFDYVCFREEWGRGQGGQEVLIRHGGHFKALLHRLSQVYAGGGHVKSFHFTDDPKSTSCYYWAQRTRAGR
jgi:hypothetical protein